MLPAWATVLIALGGSAIGAFAGVVGSFFTFRAARLSGTREELEAWRTRLIDATQAYGESWIALGVMMLLAINDNTPFDAEAKREFDATQTKFGQALTRITLLFGETSGTGKAAAEASKTAGVIVSRMSYNPPPWDKAVGDVALTEIRTADDAYDEVMRRAHFAVLPESWLRADVLPP
jgi:hypothetical protein